MSENKLYPRLSEEAEKEADLYMKGFAEKIKKIADDVLSDIYVSHIGYIESDSWTNFANELLSGLKDYKNAKIHNKYDFVQIRKQILKENREEIINDLNQDLLDEIKNLKHTIEIIDRNRY